MFTTIPDIFVFGAVVVFIIMLAISVWMKRKNTKSGSRMFGCVCLLGGVVYTVLSAAKRGGMPSPADSGIVAMYIYFGIRELRSGRQ